MKKIFFAFFFLFLPSGVFAASYNLCGPIADLNSTNQTCTIGACMDSCSAYSFPERTSYSSACGGSQKCCELQVTGDWATCTGSGSGGSGSGTGNDSGTGSNNGSDTGNGSDTAGTGTGSGTGSSSSGSGIVPCGHGTPCTLCHLFQGILNLINFGKKLLVAAAITAIVIAGIIYIVSSGSALTETAKKFLRSALIGFAVFLGAWLMIYVVGWLFGASINFQINCDTKSTAGTSTGSTGGTTAAQIQACEKWCTEAEGNNAWTTSCKQGCQQIGQPTTTTGQGMSQSEAQKALDDCGVKYSSAFSLGGLRDTTIQESCSFKNASGCTPQITPHGGTNGNHASGTYSHANGYKLDYALNSCLDNYIRGNYSNTGTRSDGAACYSAPDGACYAREGDHWDVTVGRSCSQQGC